MKNKMKIFKNEKGTTLVEIILSVTLLAIIVMPLLGAVYSSIKNNTTAKDKTEAIALAERVMGEIKAGKSILSTAEDKYPGASSGDLVPYYQIVLADSGIIEQSGRTTSIDNSAYSYAVSDSDGADFEIEIDQGTSITDKILKNVDFYKIDDSGKKVNVGSEQDFLITDKCLDFKIVNLSGNYSYYINKKTKGLVAKIGAESFNPKDTNNGIIKLRVTYDGDNTPSSAEQLKIFTTVTSDVDDILKVYVINNEENNSGVNFINKGKTDFEVNYMDSNAFKYDGTPLNKLFKVIVTIKKGNDKIYTTSSYVKK